MFVIIQKKTITKLEAKRKRGDELLIVWRTPEGDISKALEGVKFAPGDKVICPEWYGKGPMPKPRWCAGRLRLEITKEEDESLHRCLEKIITARPRSEALLPLPRPLPDLCQVPDADLWHICLGVRTNVSASKMCELADNDLLHMVLRVAT